MAKRVTTIPATRNRFSSAPVYEAKRRKVAGYARVSTDSEEQQTSYENQVDYYTTYINSREDWELVGIFTDEGITATNTRHRDGFNQMIDAAMDGKIDLIITKSVSRFARNTVDSLTTVRKLKEKGVEIYFEKENIWTFDAKGELLITIMSSLAQEESRSISENTTWGKRKSFADGKAAVAYSRFLGYDDGFKINEDEANTVRLIYKLFLSGISYYAITKELEKREIKAPCGGKKWCISTIRSILTNEKYMGDALLQKGYTADFLQKKRKKNNGEIPQYYVEDHHEAIIDPGTFKLVQAEIQKRYGEGKKYSGVSVFASKIRCGKCGGWYGSKVWHSNDKYRKVIFRCNNKYKDGQKCDTPYLTEQDAARFFLEALEELFGVKEEVLCNLRDLRQTVADTGELESKKEILIQESGMLEEKLRILIAENARVAQSQDEYNRRYQNVYGLYEECQSKLDGVENLITQKEARREIIDNFISNLEELKEPPQEFDEYLWGGVVDHMTVYEKGRVIFTFVGNIEIEIKE